MPPVARAAVRGLSSRSTQTRQRPEEVGDRAMLVPTARLFGRLAWRYSQSCISICTSSPEGEAHMWIVARTVAVLALPLVFTSCAAMPPERATRRAMLDTASTECRRSFPVVIRVEIDSFDRVVAWYKENTPQRDIDPFWQCVQDRLRQMQTLPTPPREPGIVGSHYVNEAKRFKVGIPPQEWRPSLLKDKPDQVADVAFERSGGWMAATAVEVPGSFPFPEVSEWWVRTISEKWGWTDIKALEQRDLSLAGVSGKFVAFEFSDKGRQRMEMTYHLWVPTGAYRLYRMRLVCGKPQCDEFVPIYKKFVESFAFLP